MNFRIMDTRAAYGRLLAAPDAVAREAIYREELVAPFAGLSQILGGGDGLTMFRQWGLSTDLFEEGRHEATEAKLVSLAAADAWNRAAAALAHGRAAFGPWLERIPVRDIVFGLFLGDMYGIPLQRGYTGFGGIPGYIMTVYGEPDEYNLQRVEGATVHELHHNVRFSLFPFNPMAVTVGEYIVSEGLAESFAAELYGEEAVGHYVTDFDGAQLDHARQLLGGALDVTGFNEVRGYIFGDALARHMGFPPAGVPDYAGYAVGYRAVQHYLRRTGQAVAEATFVAAQEILVGSAFFS